MNDIKRFHPGLDERAENVEFSKGDPDAEQILPLKPTLWEKSFLSKKEKHFV